MYFITNSRLRPTHLKAIESIKIHNEDDSRRLNMMNKLLERTDAMYDELDQHKLVYNMDNFIDDLNTQFSSQQK